MIPLHPYLQNAVSGYTHLFGIGTKSHEHYIQWVKDQGVKMPIMMEGDIGSVMIEFTDPKLETMFILRWS